MLEGNEAWYSGELLLLTLAYHNDDHYNAFSHIFDRSPNNYNSITRAIDTHRLIRSNWRTTAESSFSKGIKRKTGIITSTIRLIFFCENEPTLSGAKRDNNHHKSKALNCFSLVLFITEKIFCEASLDCFAS